MLNISAKRIILVQVFCLNVCILNAQWQTNVPNIYYNTGNVGIGTTTPTHKLQVSGEARFGIASPAQITLSVSDVANGAWIRNDGSNTVLSTNHGSLFLGFNGNPTKTIHLGNSNPGVVQITGNAPAGSLVIPSGGNIGIGTQNPLAKLTVVASGQTDGIWLAGTGPSNIALLNNITPGAWNSLSQTGDNLLFWKGSAPDGVDAGGLVIGPWSNAQSGLRITSSGNIGIGTPSPGLYKLAVEGTIGARKVKVTQAGWADYVFEKDYYLPSLAEVEKYIRQHKHLPDVPSAAEIEKNGLDIGDNQAVLLKKIEELTLYMIEQNKKSEEQNKKLEIQQQQIAELKEQLNRLTKNK